MISTFDATFSRMSGLNTTLIHYFVMLLLALVTVASIQTVGIILVVALLITPASTAFLISKQLYAMMVIASIISVISSIIGLYFSYIYNIPSGATIVICTFMIYIVTLSITRIKINKKERFNVKNSRFSNSILIILAACGNHSNHEHHSHEGKLKVVTTNSILYDMVKRVGGNKVDVHSIVPVGQDPHEYEVKPKDIKSINRC